jgi:hypothetical protein
LIFRSGTADPDDPFKAHAAGSTIQVGADLAMLEGRDEDAIGSTRQQPREVGLAHAQWKPPQVVAVERQDVKGDAVATPGSFRRFMFPFPFFNASSSAGTKGGALSRITIVPSRRTSTHSAPDCFAARIARAMSACAFLAVRRVMALLRRTLPSLSYWPSSGASGSCRTGSPSIAPWPVAAMNEMMTGSPGELQELNAAFKEARKVDPTMKYADYLDARKAAMLEALAAQG